jgi:hypothetical protein
MLDIRARMMDGSLSKQVSKEDQTSTHQQVQKNTLGSFEII